MPNAASPTSSPRATHAGRCALTNYSQPRPEKTLPWAAKTGQKRPFSKDPSHYAITLRSPLNPEPWNA